MDIYVPNIPTQLENLQLPSPELVTFYQNLENRTLWLDYEVDSSFLEFGRMIINWNREDKDIPIEERKPIKLMFMSPGGMLDVNNCLQDIIELSKTPVYGYNINMAASAGCFIFMACHKRFALPKAVFLLHKGSAENMSGTYDQVAAEMDEYERLINELAYFILDHSKIDKETLMQNLGSEWYVPAAKAVEYGFVDKIIDSIDELI